MLTDGALLGRIAARYRECGHFAASYVAAKLRYDPLTPMLVRLGASEPFGQVVDAGCGRGQFSCLVLEAGLANHVIGVDVNRHLLEQARLAQRDLSFEARLQDLAVQPALPAGDTVMLLDVLYQMRPSAQGALLDAAAAAARRMIVVRTADPDLGVRAWMTNIMELAARRFWPHSGREVHAQSVEWIANRLIRAGFSVAVAPCRAGTPFSNVLLVAKRTSMRE